MFLPGTRSAYSGIESRREPASAALNVRRLAEAKVLDSFTPAHVVVNRDGDIVHYSLRTGKYLEAAAGMPSRQLRPGAPRLRPEPRNALQEALDAAHGRARPG
jgi:two-component system CheB/CheR fusion protein